MADATKIEWTDATWNPITGCSLASPGCTNCYAMHLAGTRLKHEAKRAGLTREVNGNHVWTGEVRFNEAELLAPLRWKRPRMIFVCAHGDLFHESVPDVWIDRIFAVMALCTQHTFQVLTKRSARMRAYLANPARPEFLANIVLGCAPDRWGVTGEQRLAALGDRATEQQESFVPVHRRWGRARRRIARSFIVAPVPSAVEDRAIAARINALTNERNARRAAANSWLESRLTELLQQDQPA